MSPPDGSQFLELLMRVSGGLIGGLLSLIWKKPADAQEALFRLIFSAIAGASLGFIIIEKLEWERSVDHVFGAAVIMSAFSWWVFGAVVRLLDKWKPKE